MQIRQQLVTGSSKTYGGLNGRKFVTVHETANRSRGANAAAHANLQSRGNVRNASWQWQVDDKEAVQSFLNTAQCWHAGDGRGPGNLHSVGIEICVNADGDLMQAYRNAAELTRMILDDEGLPSSSVVTHGHWSGKNCPTLLLSGKHGLDWGGFMTLVDAGPGVRPEPAGQRLNPPLRDDGIRGEKTYRGWQQIMGTPVDGELWRPSAVVAADQRWLNAALGEGHIQNLTGKPRLEEDGYEGWRTIICRAFLLHNRVDRTLPITGTLTREHVRAHQRALNVATVGSGAY